jgi:serine/threonine protein kinase
LLKQWKVHQPEDIELGRPIGKGAFGEVNEAIVTGHARKLAAKMVNPSGANEVAVAKGMLMKEARAMGELAHENVVRLLGVCIDPRKMCILMELMEQGSLRQVVDTNPNLPTGRVFVILREVACGMAFAHAHTPNPILHRDLKPCNILVDRHGCCKIADFGLSSGAGTLSKTKTTGGTLAYDAPEVLDEDTWSTAGDVYSFAVLMWEVVTAKSPWEGSSIKQIIKAVLVKELRPHGKQWDEPMDEEQQRDLFLATLIKDCWAQEPGDRPSFADISTRFEGVAKLPQFCCVVSTGSATPTSPGLRTVIRQELEPVIKKIDENKIVLDENQALLREHGAKVAAMANSFTNLVADMKVAMCYHRMEMQLLETLVRDEISCPRLIWIMPKPKVRARTSDDDNLIQLMHPFLFCLCSRQRASSC